MTTVLHPTARVEPSEAWPRGWMEAEQQWYAMAHNPRQVEYVLIIHQSRWQRAWESLPVRFSPWGRTVLVCNRGRDCCVDQANAGAAASSGELLIMAMDDLFAPEGWDALLLEAVGDAQREAVVHCSSGSPQDYRLFVPQITTRARYERLGYMGYPEYESMFVDREFTDHARADGVVVEAMHIVFDHRHPDFGYKRDAVHEQENRPEAYSSGRVIYERRKAEGFPPLE